MAFDKGSPLKGFWELIFKSCEWILRFSFFFSFRHIHVHVVKTSPVIWWLYYLSNQHSLRALSTHFCENISKRCQWFLTKYFRSFPYSHISGISPAFCLLFLFIIQLGLEELDKDSPWKHICDFEIWPVPCSHIVKITQPVHQKRLEGIWYQRNISGTAVYEIFISFLSRAMATRFPRRTILL